MEILNLSRKLPMIMHMKNGFAFNLPHIKEIWIFNCYQGCQHQLVAHGIKISQISKVIITDLNITYISGLLGLLSSLSLINRKKALNIYGPKGIDKYLTFGKKYSQTNFRYNLYIHNIKTGLMINNSNYQVYTFIKCSKINILIISKEKYGKLNSIKTKDFHLIEGPLYGKLKQGSDFLLPDGSILNSHKFTKSNNAGQKFSIILNRYHKRNFIEISHKSHILQHIL